MRGDRGPMPEARELLRVTEALHAVVGEESPPEILRSAFAEREAAFEALREAVGANARVDAETGRVLARVRALDASMIATGEAFGVHVRGERQDLARRRSVIQAHARRERDAPRLLEVKA